MITIVLICLLAAICSASSAFTLYISYKILSVRIPLSRTVKKRIPVPTLVTGANTKAQYQEIEEEEDIDEELLPMAAGSITEQLIKGQRVKLGDMDLERL